MTGCAGVLRDATSLERACEAVARVDAELPATSDRATAEVRNLVDVAQALLEAATAREEHADRTRDSTFRQRRRAFVAGCLILPAIAAQREAGAKAAPTAPAA